MPTQVIKNNHYTLLTSQADDIFQQLLQGTVGRELPGQILGDAENAEVQRVPDTAIIARDYCCVCFGQGP